MNELLVLVLLVGGIIYLSKKTTAYELSEGLTPICHVEPTVDNPLHLLAFERNVNNGDVFKVTCVIPEYPLHWDYKIDYSGMVGGILVEPEEYTANLSLVSDLMIGDNEVFTFKSTGVGNVILTMYICDICPPNFETGEGASEAILFSLEITP